MIYDLPTSLTVCGEVYEIRSDYRAVLDVIAALNDAELSNQERLLVALFIFYPEFDNMPPEHCRDAIRQCFWFINGGKDGDDDQTGSPKLMDWEQDFPHIVGAINRVMGREIRKDADLHWWTFLGAYMEIGDCTFAQIVRIRDARARGKKLDKQDQEWYAKNRHLVDLKTHYTEAESDLLKLWGGG
ncbi:MAG: hypothetical protein IJF02_05135 [Oscillospiraceae bacterium]|nr:hypothetical protein [Oscillospiraceae bacterium]MBQ6852373.1 hypothetical protein [Oscillospiraceae bacterium]